VTDLKFIIDPDWKAINDELTAAYQARETAFDALEASGHADVEMHALEDAIERFWDVAEAISAMPGSALEAIGVKARAARMARPEYFEGERPETGDSSSARIWRSLVAALDGSARV
jgi:hypothetical protein